MRHAKALMPRLLPRLAPLVHAQSRSTFEPFDVSKYRPRRPASLHGPTLLSPSFDPKSYPQSILLQSENPVAAPDKYLRNKTLPPRVYVPKDARKRTGECDIPRQMTREERKWWSSPYLRMLATPPRTCAISGSLLPSDLLLRLSPLRLDNSEPTSTSPVPCVLVPDGLQHPKFTARRSNRSVHVVCSRQAISLITKNNKLEHIPFYVTIPPNLAGHISHLLRLRVLQELEVFLTQLEAKPKRDIVTNPPIRRLTEEEWKDIEERRTIPLQDAVAVIAVSPISPDVEPSMSPFPLPLDPDMELNNSLNVANMYPVSRYSDFASNFQYRDVLPSTKIPLYDSLALFPHKSQRAVLLRLLSQVQSIYETARRRRGELDISSDYSDAYLLSSNSEISKLGDMAAVATALWRVYMYERDIVK